MKQNTLDTLTRNIAHQPDRRSLLKAIVASAATLAAVRIKNTSAMGWTPEQKCDWLRDNLPQTTSTLQAFAVKYANAENVTVERIAPTIYVCNSSGDSVYDGFIILGPNEGHNEGEFTITVPPYGAINSYDESCGAKYSETPTLVAKLPETCDSTFQAKAGTVSALRASVYAWNDFNAPIGQEESIKTMVEKTGTQSSTGNATSGDTCMSVADLANTPDFKDKVEVLEDVQQPDSVTKYGGRIIHITGDGVTVPNGWEAIGPDAVHITSGGKLANGLFVSLYPPTGACREKLGVAN